MDRRRALATVAAVTFGATAIAAAVGATTRVFNVAEASPGVGRVSPVSTPTLPPVVEHRVIDVEDPLPPTAARGRDAGRRRAPRRAPTARATPPVTGHLDRRDAHRADAAATATAPTPHHEAESTGEDD